jgi:hypothetical protein
MDRLNDHMPAAAVRSIGAGGCGREREATYAGLTGEALWERIRGSGDAVVSFSHFLPR